jgi:hypothetical protein
MDNQTAFVVLTPYESRRLIAKAVAKLPTVINALKNGWVIIATGSSTGYVAEEILGEPMVKENFVSGHITAGETWGAPKNPDYIFPIVMQKGKRMEMIPEDALKEFTAEDVFIKGGNAIDAENRTAVFAGNDKGGTMGWAMGVVQARGSQLIMPVGLEKMVASVPDAAKHSGINRFAYGDGQSSAWCRSLTRLLLLKSRHLKIYLESRRIMLAVAVLTGLKGQWSLSWKARQTK